MAAANRALDKHYLCDPSQSDLTAILANENLFYQEKPLKAALGFLQRSKTHGTVIVSDSVIYPQRKRFIIAHELGHWYLHEDIEFFKCKPEFFRQWNKKTVVIEKEANIFASEFLMPTIPFKALCKGHALTKEFIIQLAERFNVSITASALRFADIGSEDVMVVYSSDRIVQWAYPSDDFPWRFYDSKFNVPEASLTDYFYDGDISDDVDEIDAIEWFGMEKSDLSDMYLNEIIVPMPEYNSCLTFLWQSEKNF